MVVMEDIIANVDDFQFDVEIALSQQKGIQPLPFPGMDKSGSAICDFFLIRSCHRGQLCPLRHISGDRMIVCKHWLRGLCKKGDDCEFLHQYDMEKMPECYFYNKYGQCSNKECPFLHLDPEAKIKDCAWYDRGFCKHGGHCKNRHVRRVMCVNYLCGFCPDGKKCKYSHPRHEVPTFDEKAKAFGHIICHACGEPGHKSSHCAVARRLEAEAAMLAQNQAPEGEATNPINIGDPTVPSIPAFNPSIPPPSIPGVTDHIRPEFHPAPGVMDAAHDPNAMAPSYFQYGKRPLEFVTCFKCRGKGHYANRCPFGSVQAPAGIPRSRDNFRPYLSHQLQQQQQQQQPNAPSSEPYQPGDPLPHPRPLPYRLRAPHPTNTNLTQLTSGPPVR